MMRAGQAAAGSRFALALLSVVHAPARIHHRFFGSFAWENLLPVHWVGCARKGPKALQTVF